MPSTIGSAVSLAWVEAPAALPAGIASPPAAAPVPAETGLVHLPSGAEATAAFGRLRAVAATPSMVLVEIARPGEPWPERASWAVLDRWRAPAARATPEPDGFSTGALRVRLDPATLALRIDDRHGRPVCHDHPFDPVRLAPAGFTLRKLARPGDRFYGLGDKPGPLEKRGRAYSMWNTDAFGFEEASDPLYKSVPFLLAVGADRRACGLFLDNTFRSGFDLAATHADAVCLAAADGPARYWVIAGDAPRDVVAGFTELVGRIALPPAWALGFGQCRYSYETAGRALEVATTHRALDVPLDAIWLDIGFQDRDRPFTADPLAFPDLGGLVRALDAIDVRTVAITDLHLPVLPGQGYAPYDTGIAGDHFVTGLDGRPYVGKVWPGLCHFPDFTRADTRAWWGGLYAEFRVEFGIAGFWNDMNEPAVFDVPGHTMPDGVRHRIEEPGFAPRIATHDEIHNVYGMQNARATHDGLVRLAPSSRPFVLTRASYAGGHRHAATWTGDNSSTFNHMRLATPQLLGLGLCGWALAGCDVGGFRGSPTPELLTEWIARGAFSPLFRDHTDFGSRDQEVWAHGEPHLSLRRRAIERRYELFAYLYTAAEEAARTGIPIVRPMFLDHPDGCLAREESQFMFGPHLMVAPPPDEILDPYRVFLSAACGWFDWQTGLRVRSAKRFRGETGLEAATIVEPARELGHVPLYARGGAIVPVHDAIRHANQRPAFLSLRVFPDPAARGGIYLDDGLTTAHRDGAYFRQAFAWEDDVLVIHPPEGNAAPWWEEIEVVVHGDAAPAIHLVPAHPGRHPAPAAREEA